VPPTASFTYSCTDLDCSFDGSGSSDNDGTITNYAWDFGDGNNGSGQSVNHSYANANGSPYTVTLTVTDDDNADDQASQLVTVSEPGGGNAAPTVDQFDVSARVTGPWSRADVAWSVSDTDGNLAQVTIALVDSSENVLDSVTTLLSGSSASGSESVKTRSGTPDAVVIIVSDANGNITLQEVPY
jgi:PKD repeat protein